MWKLPAICRLVGGFKHGFHFPFHIWDVILPIDKLHHFSTWLLHHQPVILGMIYLTGAFYVGLLDGLLGLAGACWDDDITNVMTGITPENSLP